MSRSSARIRVLVLDDEGYACRGIRMRLKLEPDIDVVDESVGRPAVLEVAVAARPDVVVIDFQSVGIDGIKAAIRLRDMAPGCAVVMLSMYDEACLRAAAAAAGVAAFVAKQQADGALLDAIRQAARPGRAV